MSPPEDPTAPDGEPDKPNLPAPPPLPPMPAMIPEPRLPADDPLPAKARSARILAAIVVPNVVALALLALTSLILQNTSDHSLSDNRSATYILAEFVVIPLLMGISAAFCLRDTETSIGVNVLVSLANTVIGIGLSALVLHEGVICLIIVSPLLGCFIAVGGLIGRLLFRRGPRRLQLSVAPVLVLLLVADACSPHDFRSSMTDVVTINAPPARVWQYVIDYPAIQEQPDYWLWRVGLPAPVQSTSTGHYVGAQRRCIFQGDIAFDERIAEMEPGRKLTFDVTAQPKDPEIMGHLDLNRGQFVLQDNHDGTTTLSGTSWYHLKVYPALYYDAWTRDIMRAVHLRVMRQIKRLAEGPDGSGGPRRTAMLKK